MRRSGNNRSTGTGQLSASLYFHAPPGIGWRLHISKIAAGMRVASDAGVSRTFRGSEKARND
jgi:hypothetical protein